MEEVRARMNDEVKFCAELDIKPNTLNHWRKRNGVPEPQLVKLRVMAEGFAADDERLRQARARELQRVAGDLLRKEGLPVLAASATTPVPKDPTGARRKLR